MGFFATFADDMKWLGGKIKDGTIYIWNKIPDQDKWFVEDESEMQGRECNERIRVQNEDLRRQSAQNQSSQQEQRNREQHSEFMRRSARSLSGNFSGY